MKSMMLCFAIAFTAGSAYANVPSANHATIYSALKSTRATPASAAPLSPARESREYQRVRGTYALDGGGTLTISRDNGRLFVDITGRPRIEVRFDAEGTLVSTDGRLIFTFREAPSGLIAHVAMTLVEMPATAMKTAP